MMFIIDILGQLQVSNGKPNMMMLYTNDTLFRSPLTSGNFPKMLFYKIKQCQEIQLIRTSHTPRNRSLQMRCASSSKPIYSR